jgi:hypothetical protein
MSQRKQNLLLASQLARGQVVGAFTEVAHQADSVAHRMAQIRHWLSNPWVWAAGSTAATFALTRARQLRPVRMLRWGWLVWRLWRSVAKRA